MIELTVLNYLSEKLTVPVYMETPEEIPESYVLIAKNGGGMENQIWSAMFAVQSIAPTLYDAAVLNETVIAAMLAMPDETEVSKCGLNSDYNFTDPDSKQYRYQAVFDIVW